MGDIIVGEIESFGDISEDLVSKGLKLDYFLNISLKNPQTLSSVPLKVRNAKNNKS